jgi:YgiT-type zinc finger domain-containing protein
MKELKHCPSCGSVNVQKVQKPWTRQYQGKTYTIPELEYTECADCGECIYDRQTMQTIEAHSPAFSHLHSRKKAQVG